MKPYGSRKSSGNSTAQSHLLSSCFATKNRLLVLPMIPSNMIVQNISRLTGILSRKNLSRDTSARRMYRLQISAQISSPKVFLHLSLKSSATSWVWKISTHQLEGECWTELSHHWPIKGPITCYFILKYFLTLL